MLGLRKLVILFVAIVLLVAAVQGISQTTHQDSGTKTVSYNGRDYLVEPGPGGATLRIRPAGSPRVLGFIVLRTERVQALNPDSYETLTAVYQAYKVGLAAAPPASVPSPAGALSAAHGEPQGGGRLTTAPSGVVWPKERPKTAMSTAADLTGDPCALLTQAQIASAIGVPVLPGERRSSCKWVNRELTRGVELSIINLQVFERKHITVTGIGDDALYQEPNGGISAFSTNNYMSLFVRQGNKAYNLTLSGNGIPRDQMKMALASLANDLLKANPNPSANASVISTTGSGPRLSVLDKPGIEGLGSSTVRLDLFRFKYAPALLNEKGGLQYFIMLNNCSAPPGQFQKAFASEFDYPRIADFYRTKAQEVLKDMPSDFSAIVSQFPDVNNPVKNAPPISILLGDYDASRKAFPFVNFQNTKRLTVVLNSYTVPYEDRQMTCPAPRGQFDGTNGSSAEYMFTFNRITVPELPMDEAAARAFVAGGRVGAAGHRSVDLMLELQLLPQAPQFSKDEGKMGFGVWKFAAQIKKVTAVDRSKQPLATVYP